MAGSRERQRQRARERHERQREERRQRRRQLRQRLSIGLAVVLVLGLAAGLSVAFAGGSAPAKSKPKASASPSATSSAATVAEPAHHCTYTTTGGGKPSLPPATPDYTSAYTATINTNLGKIDINLLNSKATCTVNSFVHLAATNFWNNTQCHRLSTSNGVYILQCGDPTASANQALSCSSTTLGTGGPGYQFADENLSGATYKAGTVAMANGAPNTNGSQFFLVYKNTTEPASYTPFGTITSGLDILQNVAKAGTSCTFQDGGGGVPKEKVIINSVTVHKS